LRDCRDLTEEPHDKGFAAAARSLTGKFRLVPVPPGKRGELTYLNLPIRLTSPQSVDFKDRHIGQPTWIRNLDPARVVQVYPAAAAAKGVQTGRGVSQCTVGVDGSLVGCKPLPGEPDGLGFSESAVMVASVMKMNPWTEEGGPVDGAVVRIPIRFNLAPDQPSGPPAKTAASVWLKIPSGDDVAAVYPNGAIDRGLSGYALLDCKVKPDGQMEDCNVVEETPRGLGFGDAALKLVPKFLMKVGPGANGPNRPRTTIPIRFLMR
jgi:TonB family protein